MSDRKAQIKNKAASLFKSKGYAATSMRQLAKAVGIEPASLYSHFKSKEAILKAICFEMAEKFFDAHHRMVSVDKTPPNQLKEAIFAHILVITENIDRAAVFFQDWRHLSGNDLQEFKVLQKNYENRFLKILKTGNLSQDFNAQDEKFCLLTIFSAMNWTFEWYKPNGQMNAEAIAANLSQILMGGLMKNTDVAEVLSANNLILE